MAGLHPSAPVGDECWQCLVIVDTLESLRSEFFGPLPGEVVSVRAQQIEHDLAAGGQMLAVEIDVGERPPGQHRDEGCCSSYLLCEHRRERSPGQHAAIGGLGRNAGAPFRLVVKFFGCEGDEAGDGDHRSDTVLQLDSGKPRRKEFTSPVAVPRPCV